MIKNGPQSVVLESSAKPSHIGYTVAEDSRTTDFRLGLLVLIGTGMTTMNILNRLVDLDLNLIWAGEG